MINSVTIPRYDIYRENFKKKKTNKNLWGKKVLLAFIKRDLNMPQVCISSILFKQRNKNASTRHI